MYDKCCMSLLCSSKSVETIWLSKHKVMFAAILAQGALVVFFLVRWLSWMDLVSWASLFEELLVAVVDLVWTLAQLLLLELRGEAW